MGELDDFDEIRIYGDRSVTKRSPAQRKKFGTELWKGRGRKRIGQRQTGALANEKLSAADVQAIKTDKRPRWVIAKEYGISEDYVSRIRHNSGTAHHSRRSG